MAETKYDAHGELLCVDETITNDTASEKLVKSACAQDREGTGPEGSTSAMDEQVAFDLFDGLDAEAQEKIICLVSFLASQKSQKPAVQHPIG